MDFYFLSKLLTNDAVNISTYLYTFFLFKKIIMYEATVLFVKLSFFVNAKENMKNRVMLLNLTGTNYTQYFNRN